LVPLLWLACTPIFLAHLGAGRYGIWMLINALLGMSGVMAFGLTDATIKFVSQYRASNNTAELQRVVRFSVTVYGLLGLVAAAALAAVAPVLFRQVFQLDPADHAIGVSALQVGGLTLALRFVDSVFQSVLYGFERYDLAARITMVINVLTFGANLALTAAGYGLVAMVAATALWLVPCAIWKGWRIRRDLLPQLSVLPLLSRDLFNTLFRFGFWSWLHGMSGILLHQLDRILVASLLGTAALAHYAICLQLAQQIHGLIARAAGFLFPLASAIKESGDLGRLRRIYVQGSNFTVVVGVGLGLPLFVFAHPILALWMGAEFADTSAGVLRVLVLVFTVLSTTVVPYYFLIGTGLVRLNTLFGLASGGSVALAALALIPIFGLAGAAWARLVNVIVDLISRAVLHFRVLSDKRWYAGLVILLPVIVPFGVGFAVSQAFPLRSPGAFALLAAAASYSLLGMVLAGLAATTLRLPELSNTSGAGGASV
jgi:O-antigen/teichoic acid export membrane protein